MRFLTQTAVVMRTRPGNTAVRGHLSITSTSIGEEGISQMLIFAEKGGGIIKFLIFADWV